MLEGTIVAWKGTILILRRAFVEVRWKESVEPGGENQQLITRCGRGKSTSQNNVLLQFNQTQNVHLNHDKNSNMSLQILCG